MNKPKKYKVAIDGNVFFANSKPELNRLLSGVTSCMGNIYGTTVTIKISLMED